MAGPLDELLGILDLEPIEQNIFRGRSPDETVQRVFGGQVAGQALVAAGRTVPPERPVHSLHAYFLRPGDPAIPIVYEVDRIRDGRSFTTRRVIAVQHGKAIFNLQASFQVDRAGHRARRHRCRTLPTRRRCRRCPSDCALPDCGGSGFWSRPRPIDVRYVGDPPWLAKPTAADEPASSRCGCGPPTGCRTTRCCRSAP